MSRRIRIHYPKLYGWLSEYADKHTLDFQKYSAYHMRMMDGGYVTLDAWTTGRYFIMQTDYRAMNPEKHLLERQYEKGMLDVLNKGKLFKWLDELFYAPYMEVENA